MFSNSCDWYWGSIEWLTLWRIFAHLRSLKIFSPKYSPVWLPGTWWKAAWKNRQWVTCRARNSRWKITYCNAWLLECFLERSKGISYAKCCSNRLDPYGPAMLLSMFEVFKKVVLLNMLMKWGIRITTAVDILLGKWLWLGLFQLSEEQLLVWGRLTKEGYWQTCICYTLTTLCESSQRSD